MFGTFAILYLVAFIAGFVISLVVYNGWARNAVKDPVLHRMAKRWAGFGLVLFTIGLLLFRIRWLQIDPFSWACESGCGWRALHCFLVVYIILDYTMNYKDNLSWRTSSSNNGGSFASNDRAQAAAANVAAHNGEIGQGVTSHQ